MILSGKKIELFLEEGIIQSDPEPPAEAFQPASLDLRFGKSLYDVEEDVIRENPDHVLEPEKQYISHTVEEISLPDNLAAFLTGRSTIGRRGVIVHKTAGWIDPGFEGQITLEMYNMSDSAVILSPGQRICQLVFFPVEGQTFSYDGKYQNQEGIVTARED